MPFANDDVARWMWTHLRRSFPVVLAVTLMPDHVHLLAPAGRDAAFVRTLTALSRRFAWGRLWRRIEPSAKLSTPDKWARGVRYASLNPSRPTKLHGRYVTLVDDPLRWPWSTHRDLLGCVVDPWVTPAHLQSALRWRGRDFLAAFHRYVTSDPHVSVSGTPLPLAAAPSRIADGSIESLRRAVLSATRAPTSHLHRRTRARRLFIHLAYRQGWRCPKELAHICHMHPNSVSRIASTTMAPAALHAASLCLGDPRLNDSLSIARTLHNETRDER